MFSPFTNLELRNLALGVKDSSHVNARRQKLLLRQSMADLLPDELLKRPKAIQRLRRDDLSAGMRRMATELDLDQSLVSRGLIAKNTVASLLQERNARQSKAKWNDLWGLICVETWMRIFHDHRGAAVQDTTPLIAN